MSSGNYNSDYFQACP